MGALAACAAHVIAAVGAQVHLDPGEGGPSVAGAAPAAVVDDGGHRRAAQVGIGPPGHPAQPGSGQDLVAHHRRDRVAGQTEHRGGADPAEGKRLGRADGHLHPVHGADPVQDHLDQVEVAHAHAAAGQHGVAAGRALREAPFDLGLVVGCDAEVHGREPVPAQQGHQGAPVGVADLAREQRPASFDQLIAGGEHADDGSRHHGHLFPAHTAQHADVAGTEHGAGGEDLLTGRHVLTSPPHVDARRGRGGHPDLVALAAGGLDDGHGVGSLGERGARHDAQRLAGPDRGAGRLPGGQGADHRQPGGLGRAGRGHVRGPHRVAVHGRIGERRHVLGRGHRLGQHQPDGVTDLHHPGRFGRARRR